MSQTINNTERKNAVINLQTIEETIELNFKTIRSCVKQKLYDLERDLSLQRGVDLIFRYGDRIEIVPVTYIWYDRSFKDFVCLAEDRRYDYLLEHLTIEGCRVLLYVLENLEDYELPKATYDDTQKSQKYIKNYQAMTKATLFNRFVCVIVLAYMALFEESVKSIARGILFRGYWWQFVGYTLHGSTLITPFDYIEWYDAVVNFGSEYRPQWHPLSDSDRDMAKWHSFVDQY